MTNAKTTADIMELNALYSDDDILYSFMILNSLHDKHDYMLEDYLTDVEHSQLAVILAKIEAYNKNAEALRFEDYYSADLKKGLHSIGGLSAVERGNVTLQIGDVSENVSATTRMANAGIIGITPEHAGVQTGREYDEMQRKTHLAADEKNRNRYNLYFTGVNAIGQQQLKPSMFPLLQLGDPAIKQHVDSYTARKNELSGWQYGLWGRLPGAETREDKLNNARVEHIEKPLAEINAEIDRHEDVLTGCMSAENFKLMQQYFYQQHMLSEMIEDDLHKNLKEFFNADVSNKSFKELSNHFKRQKRNADNYAKRALRQNDERALKLAQEMEQWYETRLAECEQAVAVGKVYSDELCREYKTALTKWVHEKRCWDIDDLIKWYMADNQPLYNRITAHGNVEDQICIEKRQFFQTKDGMPRPMSLEELRQYLEEQQRKANTNKDYSADKNAHAHTVADIMHDWYANRIAQLKVLEENPEIKFDYNAFVQDYNNQLSQWHKELQSSKDKNGLPFPIYDLTAEELLNLHARDRTLLTLRQMYREVDLSGNEATHTPYTYHNIKNILYGQGFSIPCRNRLGGLGISSLSAATGIHFEKNGLENLSGFNDLFFNPKRVSSGVWNVNNPFTFQNFRIAVSQAGLMAPLPDENSYVAWQSRTGEDDIDLKISETLRRQFQTKVAYDGLRKMHDEFLQGVRDGRISLDQLKKEIESKNLKTNEELIASINVNELSQKMHSESERMLINVGKRLLQPEAAADKTYEMLKTTTGMAAGFAAGVAAAPTTGFVGSLVAGVAADVLTTEMIEANEYVIKSSLPYQLLNYCTSSDMVLEMANNGIWEQDMPLYREQLKKLTTEYEERTETLLQYYQKEDIDTAIDFALRSSQDADEKKYWRVVKLGRRIDVDLKKELQGDSKSLQKCYEILGKLQTDPQHIGLRKELEHYQKDVNSPMIDLIIERNKLQEEVSAASHHQIRLMKSVAELSGIANEIQNNSNLKDEEKAVIQKHFNQLKEGGNPNLDRNVIYQIASGRMGMPAGTKSDEYIVRLFDKYNEIYKIKQEQLPTPYSTYLAQKHPDKWKEIEDIYKTQPNVLKQIRFGRLPLDYLVDYQQKTTDIDNAINGALSGNFFYWASSKEVLSDDQKENMGLERTDAFLINNYHPKDVENLQALSKEQSQCISAMVDYSLRIKLFNAWERSGRSAGDIRGWHSRNYSGDKIDIEEVIGYPIGNNGTDEKSDIENAQASTVKTTLGDSVQSAETLEPDMSLSKTLAGKAKALVQEELLELNLQRSGGRV